MNPLGAQSALKGASRPDRSVILRKVWGAKGDLFVLTASTTTNQTLGPIGTPFANAALYYRLSSFYDSSDPVINAYDKFRFKSITVYGFNASTNALCELKAFTSVDLDDRNVDNWQQIRQRQNVAISMIRPNNPGQIVGKWKPVANFGASPGSSADNMVPAATTWFDTTADTQEFVGLKCHFESVPTFAAPSGARPNQIMLVPFAEIEFQARI